MITKVEEFSWRTKGFVLLKNIIEPELIQKSKELIEKKYNLEKPPHNDFGSIKEEFEFPTGKILDKITLHPKIIQNVSKLLKTKEILLTQSDAWSKIGSDNLSEQSNTDQRIHMDYGNHSFLHACDWNEPEVVTMIVYLTDTTETGGGTALVPRKYPYDELYKMPYINMPGQNKFKFYNDKKHTEDYFLKNYPNVAKFREKLYDREVIINAKAGDILFYRLDLWHRGTPVKKNKIRHVMNLAYKKRSCYWINVWNKSYTRELYYGYIEKMFCELTPRQREVIGIPKIGDNYWSKKKLNNLKARYPNFDIKPYLSKL